MVLNYCDYFFRGLEIFLRPYENYHLKNALISKCIILKSKNEFFSEFKKC